MNEIVKIPKELRDRLKGLGPHFIRVSKQGKEPIDKNWPLNPRNASDPTLQDWLLRGGNYGVIGGYGLMIVDVDLPDLKKIVKEKLPETFTVQSPGSKGWHLYFLCALEKPIRLRDKEGTNIGDIQAQGKMVVGPGSIHPNGKKYEVVKDRALAQITRDQLVETFKEFVVSDHEIAQIEATALMERKKSKIDLNILDVVPLVGLKQRGSEYFGPHPIHGSKTGQNFWVNPGKNCWHCFRHSSGGGPLLWLAVQEGIIDCSEATPGALRGDTFKRTLKRAKELGLVKDQLKTGGKLAFFDKKKRFIPAKLSEHIQSKYTFKTPKGESGHERATIWRYSQETGIFTPDGVALVEKESREALGDEYKQAKVSDVISHVKISTYVDRDKFEAPKNLIALKNGVFDLETKKLKDFSPDYNLKAGLPVKYDPNAKCPAILKFIEEIQPDEKARLTMQEFVGYCFHRATPFHKAAMFVGEGNNGKSSFMLLLAALLGTENIKHLSLQELCFSRFARAELYGKLANVHADLTEQAIKFTGPFKMFVAGDRIDAQKKFRDYFEFEPYAKHIYSANRIPMTEDESDAYYRRWIILTFPNRFEENDPKTKPQDELLKELTTEEELSGFFNYALEGLKRLLEQKHFTKSETVDVLRDHYIKASDPIKSFAIDCLSYNSKADPIIRADLYEYFVRYCEQNNMPKKSKTLLTQRLPQHIPGIRSESKSIGGKTYRVWLNLSYHEPTEEEEEKTGQQTLKVGERELREQRAYVLSALETDSHATEEGRGVKVSDFVAALEKKIPEVKKILDLLVKEGVAFYVDKNHIKLTRG